MRQTLRNVAFVMFSAVTAVGYAQASASTAALQAKLAMPAAPAVLSSAIPHPSSQSVHITMRVIDMGVSDMAGMVGYQFENANSSFSAPLLVRAPGGEYTMTNGQKSAKIYMIVNSDGVPSGLSLEHSEGGQFDHEALATAAAFRFKPAMYNGVAVPSRLSIELRVAKN